jgi:hypothetical protein
MPRAADRTADHCRCADLGFSLGYGPTEVRAAIFATPSCVVWIAALDQDGTERSNGQLAELTNRVEPSSWTNGSHAIVRRERQHPSAPTVVR